MGSLSVTPDRITAFVKSFGAWLLQGRPVRTPARVRELFEQACQPCPFYVAATKKKGHCSICGCIVAGDGRVINKLRMAGESCPADPPRFQAEAGVTPTKPSRCGGCP